MVNKLYKIISDVMSVPVSEINDNTGPDNVDAWDSLNGLRLMDKLVQTFKIHFTINDLTMESNVGDIKKVLEERGVKL